MSIATAARPPREFRSAAGDLLLRIDRGKPPTSECRAELSRQGDNRERLWSRPLVNDTAPEMAFIRADAKYVITLNEYRHGGARHALVVYGEKGELLRHWTLPDLLGESDWSHLEIDRKSLVWLTDAEFAFTQPDRFEVELGWGRKIAIDLTRVALVDPPTPSEAAVPPPIAALLWPSRTSGESAVAATNEVQDSDAATDDDETEELAGELRGDDVATTSSDDDEDDVPSLVDILAEIASGGQNANAADLSGEPPHFVDGNPIVNPAESAADSKGADTAVAQPDAAAHPDATPATTDAIAIGSIPVPAPNPANPVDYIAWANQFTRSDPVSVGIKDAAVNGVVEYSGDRELYERAQAGDPTAINDPQIVAWLDANREAMQNFRNWTLYDYRGRQMQSDDGMMISVLLPDLSKLRTLAKMSSIEARRMASSGDAGGAVDVVLDNLRAGRHTAQGVTLIENLVGHAMQALTSDTLLDLAADPANDARIDYSDLAARLEYAYEPPPPAADIVQFERVMSLDTMQRVFEPAAGGGPPRPRWDKLNLLLAMNGEGSADFTTALKAAGAGYDDTIGHLNQFYDDAATALRNPFPKSVGDLKALEESTSTAAKLNPLVGAFAPSLTKIAEVATRGESRRRATMLVTNLMAYKQQHGVFPETLDAFADRPFARDPFTESSFRYERTADGSFRLYSTGADQTDNGGIHDDGRVQDGKQTDVVFWPRPTKKK